MALQRWLQKWHWLKEWQTLAGATLGFLALSMASYLSSCQQRQALYAQRDAQIEERQHLAESVRAIFFVEITGIKVTCTDAATKLADKSQKEIAIALPPYDENIDKFFPDIINLDAVEISTISATENLYRTLRFNLPRLPTVSAIYNGFSVSGPATKAYLVDDFAACARVSNDTLNTIRQHSIQPRW